MILRLGVQDQGLTTIFLPEQPHGQRNLSIFNLAIFIFPGGHSGLQQPEGLQAENAARETL